MKNFILIIVLILSGSSMYAQTTFRKKYFIPDSISFSTKERKDCEKDDSDNNVNKKDKSDSIVRLRVLKYNSKTETYSKGIAITYGTLGIRRNRANDKSIFGLTQKNKGNYLKGNVKLDGKHLFVNHWLFEDTTFYRDSIIGFTLRNRQQIKLSYRQWTVTPVTIPFKVRFGDDRQINYSTGIALGGLVGYSAGRTKFQYRKSIGNFQRSNEITAGVALSFGSLEFENDYKKDVNTTYTSLGIGVLYSYEKVNLGLLTGLDFANGAHAQSWDFHGKPWLGVVIGYSIFD